MSKLIVDIKETNWYITFPQRNGEMRDKYVVVAAANKEQAKKLAYKVYGNNYSMVYSEEDFIGSDYAEAYGLTKANLGRI